MLTLTAMAAIPGSALQERFLSTAKELVSRDLGLLGRQGESWDLAGDLHRLGGEAAMVNLPEVAQAAREGEEAAHLLGSASDRQARVTCGRLLRKLSYLLQELSAKRPTPVPTEARRAAGGGRRVLVVDDSPVAAQALADVLEVRGFEVRNATSLGAVMTMCASFCPAVLVADVQMPNLDVVELCQRFREVRRGQRTAILLISGRSEAELRDRLDAIRPEAFVSKLAGADVVVSRVAALFQGFQE
jgi:CheY-like chemotaxis protein/HPt (histidine-containing phosphotransfer) domain-containing protein